MEPKSGQKRSKNDLEKTSKKETKKERKWTAMVP